MRSLFVLRLGLYYVFRLLKNLLWVEPMSSWAAAAVSSGINRKERIPRSTNVEEAAARLAAESQDTTYDPSEQVFDPNLASDEIVYEETLPDGTRLKHRKIQSNRSTSGTEMELVEMEGPAREETELEEHEEVLPDGTVHKKHTIRRHSVKHIRKSLKSEGGEDENIVDQDLEVPGTLSEDIIETFDQPPRMVTEEEEVEQVLPDGKTVKRNIVMNRMVHHIKTKHQSFDESGKKEEDYEIEEIIPGTVSAFIAGTDTESESESESGDEELQARLTADVGELEEVLDDGTIVARRLVASQEKRTVRSRSGSIDESQESRLMREEVVIPSPRSGSPIQMQGPAGEQVAPYDVHSHVPVQTTFRSTHLEEKRTPHVIEDTIDVMEDMVARGELKAEKPLESSVDPVGVSSKASYDADTPVITITEDNSTPPDEDDYVSYFGLNQEGHVQEGDSVDSPTASGGDGDQVQSTRLMMKKEIHKKTVIGMDGNEETFIKEESQIQQDNEPPEELRGSMQEIIDQFMESEPQVPQITDAKLLEDDV